MWCAFHRRHLLPGIQTIKDLCYYIVERASRPLDAVLLPSYGGVSHPYHEVPPDSNPKLLADTIEKVAKELKAGLNVKLGGLPHPVTAVWSDYEFVKLGGFQSFQ